VRNIGFAAAADGRDSYGECFVSGHDLVVPQEVENALGFRPFGISLLMPRKFREYAIGVHVVA